MSNFKVGDLAKVINETFLGDYGVCDGDIVVIKNIGGTRAIVFNPKYKETINGKNLVSIALVCLEQYSYYESSNRYKLKQAIKETGISSRKLSHFAVGNESFFYNQTGQARFKEYGDISSSKLDSMLVLLEVAKINLNAKITQDAFDEREKLDLAAKTVDENNFPVKKFKPEDVKITFGDVEINNIGNSDQEDYSRFINEATGLIEDWKHLDSHIDQLQSQAIEKRDYRLRNYCCAFITILLLLAIYFFTK